MEVWDIFFNYSGELNLIDIIKLKGTWLYAIWTAYLSWNSPKPYFHRSHTSSMFPKTPELFVNKLLWKNMLLKSKLLSKMKTKCYEFEELYKIFIFRKTNSTNSCLYSEAWRNHTWTFRTRGKCYQVLYIMQYTNKELHVWWLRFSN